jgi:hypothetical protein
VLGPRAAALAADANPAVLPVGRLRLWHVADVAALAHGHSVGPSVKSAHGGFFVRATVDDGSRLPLEGIRMNKRAPPNTQLSLSQCVFGFELIVQRARSAFPLTLMIPVMGNAAPVAVTLAITGEFAAGS